jgi:hypothetical protein
VERARADVQPAPEHDIPNAVLVAEVLHWFPLRPSPRGDPPNLTPLRQYAGFRLMGFGRTEAEREKLAAQVADTRGDGTRFGLMFSSGNPPRHSHTAGQRKQARRRRKRT